MMEAKEGRMELRQTAQEGATLHLEVEASVEDVERAFAIAQQNFCQQMGIVPADNQSFAEAARQRGIADLDVACAPWAVAALIPFVLDACGAYPAFAPAPPEGVDIKRGAGCSFSLDVVVRPVYELSTYEPLELEVYPFSYDAAAVDAQMEQLAKEYATYEETDEQRPVKAGDAVRVTFGCSLDGVPIKELGCERCTYVVGSGAMPEEFDRNIEGMQTGETKTFSFTATSHDGSSLELKTYEGTVSVHALLRALIPNINDAWVAKNIPSCSTVEELRELMASQLDGVRRASYDDYVRTVAASEAATRLVGGISPEVLMGASKTFLADLRQQVAAQGTQWDDFVAQNGGKDKLYETVVSQTHRTLTECYALDAVFAHERLSVSDADILDVCAQINPEDPRGVRAAMESQGFGYTLRESAERFRANCWLVDQAHISHIRESEGER